MKPKLTIEQHKALGTELCRTRMRLMHMLSTVGTYGCKPGDIINRAVHHIDKLRACLHERYRRENSAMLDRDTTFEHDFYYEQGNLNAKNLDASVQCLNCGDDHTHCGCPQHNTMREELAKEIHHV